MRHIATKGAVVEQSKESHLHRIQGSRPSQCTACLALASTLSMPGLESSCKAGFWKDIDPRTWRSGAKLVCRCGFPVEEFLQMQHKLYYCIWLSACLAPSKVSRASRHTRMQIPQCVRVKDNRYLYTTYVWGYVYELTYHLICILT